LHLVGYFHDRITMHEFMNVNNRFVYIFMTILQSSV